MSHIDLTTAHVEFSYEPIGDYPDGDYNIGRRYYWFNPGDPESFAWDHDLRDEHPDVGDHEWQRLFYEAFVRGQKAYRDELLREQPDLADTEIGRGILMVGELFGPRPPRRRSQERPTDEGAGPKVGEHAGRTRGAEA
jgi:hypothetical protein